MTRCGDDNSQLLQVSDESCASTVSGVRVSRNICDDKCDDVMVVSKGDDKKVVVVRCDCGR